MELQKTKLKDEHARPLGLDALLSEYGIGLKNVCSPLCLAPRKTRMRTNVW